MIAARPFTIPYLTALLPSELEIQQMEETDSSEQEEQTDTENNALHISTVGPPLLPASQQSQNSLSHILPLPLGTEHIENTKCNKGVNSFPVWPRAYRVSMKLPRWSGVTEA